MAGKSSYINREQLLYLIDNHAKGIVPGKTIGEQDMYRQAHVDIVEDVVRQCHNLDFKEAEWMRPRKKGIGLYCSNCREHISEKHKVSYLFCPYCGSYMKKGEKLK